MQVEMGRLKDGIIPPNAMLSKLVLDSQTRIGTIGSLLFLLPIVLLVMNPQAILHTFYCWVGKYVRLLDLVYGAPAEDMQHWDSPDSFVNDQQNKMREAHELARQSMGKAAERCKEYYDHKVHPVSFFFHAKRLGLALFATSHPR